VEIAMKEKLKSLEPEEKPSYEEPIDTQITTIEPEPEEIDYEKELAQYGDANDLLTNKHRGLTRDDEELYESTESEDNVPFPAPETFMGNTLRNYEELTQLEEVRSIVKKILAESFLK
jgi:hypothetical protein